MADLGLLQHTCSATFLRQWDAQVRTVRKLPIQIDEAVDELCAMSEDKDLKSWVAAELHTLVGFSQSTVVSYILAVAKKHSSSESLAVVLRQQGLPSGPETNAFASQLLSRLPRKGSGGMPSVHAQQNKQAKELIKKNNAYGLLEDDDEDRPTKAPDPMPAAAAAPAKGKERKLRTKKEAPADDDDGAGDGGAMLPQGKRQRRAWEEDEEDPADREERLAEERRVRDKQEKEEFEARLRLRDETKTKKLAPEEKLSKAEMQEQERRK